MNAVIREMRLDDVAHDPFGTALAWQFAIADALTVWGPPYPPAAWEYRSPCGPDTDEPRFIDLDAMLTAGTVTAAELVKAGNICARMVRLAKLADRDY